MVPGEPPEDEFHDRAITTRLQLKKHEPEPFSFREYAINQEPTTPSQWFSKMFPEQARIFGCPFIELVDESADGLKKVNPLAPNIDFLAAILGGDVNLGHKVIYLEAESQFYFLDPVDKIFKPTSDEKFGNLLRALLIRCAEELPNTVHKLNLFLEFRSDKTIRAIVHRAKSILAADHTFFGVESKHQRQRGPELHERVARVFAEQVLERQPGGILPLTTAYLVFCEFLKRKSMDPVKRGVFRGMFSPIIRELFDLGLRNDIQDPVTKHQTAGWKGIRTLDLEDDLVAK
jgi:hypothetical protein